MERLRRRRPPGDGVHAELQQQRRRLPDRSQRAPERRHLRRRHRHRRHAQQRVLHPPVAPAQWHHYAFVFDTHGAGGAADHAVRRRPARAPTPSSTAAPAPATSPTRRCTSCRAPASAVRRRRPRRASRSTTRALSASTIAEHYGSYGTNRRPVATLHGVAEPGAQARPGGDLRRARPPATPTARSSSTSGTSTATAATRPTPARPRAPRRPTRPRSNVDVQPARLRHEQRHRRRDAHRRRSATSRRRPRSRSQPNPAVIGRTVTFNGSGSSDTDGTIAKYEWDLDGNGTYETDTGTTPTTTRSLRDAPATSPSACASPTTTALTDDDHARASAWCRRSSRPRPRSRPRPTRPSQAQTVSFDALRLERSRRLDRQVRVGPRRQRHLRDRHRHHADDDARLHDRGRRSPVGLRVTDGDGMTGTTTVPRLRQRHRDHLLAEGAGHRRPRALLAHGRHGAARRWPTAKGSSPATLSGGATAGRPGRRRRRLRHGGQLRRRRRLRPRPTSNLLEHQQAHGRVLAQVERVRQQRRPRARVHAQLQRQPGRLPRRPELPGQRRPLHARPRSRGVAQHRLVHASRARASGTTTRWCSTPTAPAGQQITPYVDGQAGLVHQERERHRRRPVRQLAAVLHVAGGTALSPSGTTLFGAGDLDELAVYDRVLTPPRSRRSTSRRSTTPPIASFTASPNPATPGQTRELQRLGLERLGRHDRQVRVGPRRQRHLRDRHRHHADDVDRLRRPRATGRSACA